MGPALVEHLKAALDALLSAARKDDRCRAAMRQAALSFVAWLDSDEMARGVARGPAIDAAAEPVEPEQDQGMAPGFGPEPEGADVPRDGTAPAPSAATASAIGGPARLPLEPSVPRQFQPMRLTLGGDGVTVRADVAD